MLAATGLLLAVPMAAGQGGTLREHTTPSSSRAGGRLGLRRSIRPDRTIHVQIVRSGHFDTYKLAVTPVSACCGGCGRRVPVRGASCTRAHIIAHVDV